MAKNSNQTIKCNVCSCKYNDDSKYLCTLKEINISCTCNKENCNTNTETVCNSFIEK